MAIKFNVLEIGNPSNPAAPKKFYARPVSSGEVSLEDLSEDISYASSVNQSDVYAVLQSLVREIPRNISRGLIVRLGNLGAFRLSANSRSEEHTSELQSLMRISYAVFCLKKNKLH